jgi:hypothetical protein
LLLCDRASFCKIWNEIQFCPWQLWCTKSVSITKHMYIYIYMYTTALWDAFSRKQKW